MELIRSEKASTSWLLSVKPSDLLQDFCQIFPTIPSWAKSFGQSGWLVQSGKSGKDANLHVCEGKGPDLSRSQSTMFSFL